MKLVFKSLAVVSSLAILGACTSNNRVESKKNGVVTLNSSAIVSDSNLTYAQKAEKLAKGAEQLLSASGFAYANIVLDQALASDSSNQRAQFLKAFIATPMTFQGILNRIKPLAQANSKSKKSYDEYIKSFPNGSLKTFLLEGEPDIKNEKDVQAFLDNVYQAQDSFRKFLKANKSLELTIQLTDDMARQAAEEESSYCQAEFMQDGSYKISGCDFENIQEVKIGRADIEVLQQMASGMQIYLATLVSYDATGAIAASQRYQNKPVSNKVLWKELSKNPDFAKLRNSEALRSIVEIGTDAIAGIRWAVQLQGEVCPMGEENRENRRGYLVKEGICVNDENEDGTSLEDVLKTVESALAGQAIEIKIGNKLGHGKAVKAMAKPVEIFENPIADLKLLRPVYNSCDNVQSVSDDTLGGVFPNHDANEVLGAQAECINYDYEFYNQYNTYVNPYQSQYGYR